MADLGIKLRGATPADADALRALVRASYSKWIPTIGREPRPMSADYSAAIREHLVEVVDGDHGIVAALELIPAADHMFIQNIVVAEYAQGQGIGSALLLRAETIAGALGLQEMRLLTNERMVSNRALYLRRGYEEYALEPILGGPGAVHMRKSLALPE